MVFQTLFNFAIVFILFIGGLIDGAGFALLLGWCLGIVMEARTKNL